MMNGSGGRTSDGSMRISRRIVHEPCKVPGETSLVSTIATTHAPPRDHAAAGVRSLVRALKVPVGVFLLWTAIAAFFATQLYFAGLPWQRALAWTLPRWYSWGLVTPGVFWLDRRLADRTSLPVRVSLHVPLAV